MPLNDLFNDILGSAKDQISNPLEEHLGAVENIVNEPGQIIDEHIGQVTEHLDQATDIIPEGSGIDTIIDTVRGKFGL